MSGFKVSEVFQSCSLKETRRTRGQRSASALANQVQDKGQAMEEWRDFTSRILRLVSLFGDWFTWLETSLPCWRLVYLVILGKTGGTPWLQLVPPNQSSGLGLEIFRFRFG